MAAFEAKLGAGDRQVIEFGGKPFGDHHAERVLPGYEADIKGLILQQLCRSLGDVSLAMSLHAQDVLHAPNGRRVSQRIRGDSGLHYDDEVVRLADQARDEFDLPLDTVVLTALPTELTPENEDYVGTYTERLEEEGLTVKTVTAHRGYPLLDVGTVHETLTQDEQITDKNHLIVVSPGGGSGKFGVAVTQIAHLLQQGNNPNFVKFETFPVFSLKPSHPLNIAFLAATNDLPNELIVTAGGKTNYDKDEQNLSILRSLMTHYPELDSPLHAFEEPTDMGVNVIEEGIVDDEAVREACNEEVVRRIVRYKREQGRGEERPETVARTEAQLKELDPDRR